jgi:lipoyl(octanoyl) transferase
MPRVDTGKTGHRRANSASRFGYAGAVNAHQDAELIYAKVGFGPQSIGYLQAWDLQRALHERRVNGDIPDCCLLLEHWPVYTAGKRTSPLDRPVADPGAPVIEVDRGGKITWHGPGQLVGYPIIGLGEPVDVIAYVRAIEEALIRVCADFGVVTTRIEGRSGVWIPGGAVASSSSGPGGSPGVAAGLAAADRKVGAIGIRIAKGVTMHGFSLNCDCDLSWYDQIVPCGIRDASVTTLSAEAGRPVTVADVVAAVQPHLAQALGARHWRTIEGTAGLLPLTPVQPGAVN